LYEEG